MVTTHYQKFFSSIKWNSYEQLFYQTALLGHQVLLCKTVGMTEFGVIGTAISVIYLIGALLNFGFDMSIAPFFTTTTKSKPLLQRIFLNQLLIQLAILLLVPLIIFAQSKQVPFLGEKIDALDFSTLVFGWLLIPLECIKKSLRNFLQCAFLNKKLAFIETSTMALFICMVWGLYFFKSVLSLKTLLFSLTACSLLSVIFLSRILYHFYLTLSDDSAQALPDDIKNRIFKSRLFGYSNQINHQIFSSNVIAPSLALFVGVQEAGALTLTSAVTYFLNTLVKKILGNSTEATFSNAKEIAVEEKRKLFNQTAGIAYYVLSVVAIVFLITCPTLMHLLGTDISPTALLPIYLYIVFNFSENFFMSYEKFFVTEEKTHIFAGFNFLALSLIAITLKFVVTFSVIIGLGLILAIRLFSFGSLALFSFHRWGIKPSFNHSLYHISYPVIASILFVYILR